MAVHTVLVLLLAGEDDAVVLLLEPLLGVGLGQPVGEANVASLLPPVQNVHAGSTQDNVEVHAVDADAGIVLDAQIDVLLDAKAKVAVVGKVLLPQLVLFDLEAALQNLLGLGASDGAVDRDLLVTTDTEGPDSVTGLGEDRGLSSQGLKHLAGTGQSVTRLAHTNVEAQLSDPQVPHRVLGLVFLALSHFFFFFLL